MTSNLSEATLGHRVLGVTLARGGSRGIPGKNIRPLAGRPLLEYSISQALSSLLLTRYIVSTDDPEIQRIAMACGAEAPFLRPTELSSDSATSVAALQHAVHFVEQEEGREYDYVVEIMATNPFKSAEDIDNCVSLLVDSGADSVIAVHRIQDHHPARIKLIEDGLLRDFCFPEVLESRRQDLTPHAFVRSGSIYALTRRELMVESRRYGSENSRAYILDADRVVNLDSEIDWLIAEAMVSKQERLS